MSSQHESNFNFEKQRQEFFFTWTDGYNREYTFTQAIPQKLMVIIASSLYENIDVKIRKFIKENLILELVAFNFLGDLETIKA